MRGGGGIFLVQGPLARVLNAQAGGDDEQFAGGVLVLRLQQHAAESRIDWQPREVTPE